MNFKSSSTFNMGISQCGAKGYIKTRYCTVRTTAVQYFNYSILYISITVANVPYFNLNLQVVGTQCAYGRYSVCLWSPVYPSLTPMKRQTLSMVKYLGLYLKPNRTLPSQRPRRNPTKTATAFEQLPRQRLRSNIIILYIILIFYLFGSGLGLPELRLYRLKIHRHLRRLRFSRLCIRLLGNQFHPGLYSFLFVVFASGPLEIGSAEID